MVASSRAPEISSVRRSEAASHLDDSMLQPSQDVASTELEVPRFLRGEGSSQQPGRFLPREVAAASQGQPPRAQGPLQLTSQNAPGEISCDGRKASTPAAPPAIVGKDGPPLLPQARAAGPAIGLSQDLLDRFPRSAGARCSRAIVLTDACRYREALGQLNSAERLLGREHSFIHQLRGEALLARGDFVRAERSLRQALPTSSDPSAYLSLARTLLFRELVASALQILRRAWRRWGQRQDGDLVAEQLALFWMRQQKPAIARFWLRHLPGAEVLTIPSRTGWPDSSSARPTEWPRAGPRCWPNSTTRGDAIGQPVEAGSPWRQVRAPRPGSWPARRPLGPVI